MAGLHIQHNPQVQALKIPVGAIVPFLDSGAAPSGWSLFTSANGKMIRGASGSIAVGNTTTGAVSESGTTSTNGAHNLTTTTMGEGDAIPSVDGGTASAGGHAHSFTGVGTAEDVSKTFQLIKANAEVSKLPAGSVLFSNTDLSLNITQQESSLDRFLKAESVYGTLAGSATLSLTYGDTNTGNHTHGLNDTFAGDGAGSGSDKRPNSEGSHGHTGTLTGTMDTKHFYLTAWGEAAAAFALVENGIVMYESLTPPTGWVLCDGNNGTPDLQEHFIRIGSVAQMGTNGGDNLCNVSTSTSSAGDHDHLGSTVNNSYPISVDHATGGAHTHTASVSNVDCTSPSYALAFIMKAA